MIADWPTLTSERLYEGRDLYPTTDLRGMLKGLLADQFGLTPKTLAEVIFPDSAGVAPMKGLSSDCEKRIGRRTGQLSATR